jgi:hypothetical protein
VQPPAGVIRRQGVALDPFHAHPMADVSPRPSGSSSADRRSKDLFVVAFRCSIVLASAERRTRHRGANLGGSVERERGAHTLHLARGADETLDTLVTSCGRTPDSGH